MKVGHTQMSTDRAENEQIEHYATLRAFRAGIAEAERLADAQARLDAALRYSR
jgi:hypothetical protein